MKKFWTLAVIAALGISTIGCETATTPPAKPAATDKPMPESDTVKPEGEMKEGDKPAEGDAAKPAEGDAAKPAEGGADKPADPPK